ncbi:MAG: sigma-70 family RNA polymerase sigma factor [Stappiaceae bacterium]
MEKPAQNESLARFTDTLPVMRAELHRYLARMTGSVLDGEDVLQDALLAAAIALQEGAEVENMRAWLFRIAHNTALNMFRARKREAAMKDELLHLPPAEQPEAPSTVPEALTPYLALTPLQRSIVILRDVLGYSAKEVAELTDASTSAVKSALHRGRFALSAARAEPQQAKASTLPEAQAEALHRYVDLFNAHDFDALRDMLSAEVRLELVSVDRREGKERVSGYFSNYAKRDDWHMTPGLVEGRPAILARDRDDPHGPPTYFILLNTDTTGVTTIRDFRYARYAMQDAEWEVLK